jgi:hypothetical protein
VADKCVDEFCSKKEKRKGDEARGLGGGGVNVVWGMGSQQIGRK